MDDNTTRTGKAVRPTKKQSELLGFIESFIAEHGYSPSYREIMHGKNYNSVATVALHVNNLIKRGHLVKRGRSARSLEVVKSKIVEPVAPEVEEAREKWLIEAIGDRFDEAELSAQPNSQQIDDLYVLIGALKVLGYDDAARSFIPRLSLLQNPDQDTDKIT